MSLELFATISEKSRDFNLIWYIHQSDRNKLPLDRKIQKKNCQLLFIANGGRQEYFRKLDMFDVSVVYLTKPPRSLSGSLYKYLTQVTSVKVFSWKLVCFPMLIYWVSKLIPQGRKGKGCKNRNKRPHALKFQDTS